ncbi:hypothetical protein JCM8097_009350 [Rhodosporidiobolus ruineniae]
MSSTVPSRALLRTGSPRATLSAQLLLARRGIASSAVVQNYKPSEHGGKKEDGGEDKRVKSSHGLASDATRATKTGEQSNKTGGKASSSPSSSSAATSTPSGSGYTYEKGGGGGGGGGGEHHGSYKPKEHGGKRKDGQEDKRTRSEHGFGADKERAKKLGSEGGKH